MDEFVEQNTQLPPRLLEMSAEEMAFRGWTREDIRERWAKRVELDKTSPQIGELAPDFELERLASHGGRSGEKVKLSSMRGRPVGIYFGSFT